MKAYNKYADSLRDPLFRQKKIKAKKGRGSYKRKNKHRKGRDDQHHGLFL